MKKIESYEQIQKFVQDVRKLKKGFVTNFYWDSNKHPYWIEDGSFEFVQYEGCIFLFHNQRGFTNLFFVASDFNVIKKRLSILDLKVPIIIDLVCKGDAFRELATLKSIGFEKYQCLYRMSHVGKLAEYNWVKDSRVIFASKLDVGIVYDTLQREFDPLSEQLPSIKELFDFQERNQLLIVKNEHKLCGFLIFELLGKTWYLRYWYTCPEYRNHGVGSALLKTSLIYGIESKRQIFWVIADNKNAIVRYEHYGFARENINDYVIIKK